LRVHDAVDFGSAANVYDDGVAHPADVLPPPKEVVVPELAKNAFAGHVLQFPAVTLRLLPVVSVTELPV
jgi:hypothetical protein